MRRAESQSERPMRRSEISIEHAQLFGGRVYVCACLAACVRKYAHACRPNGECTNARAYANMCLPQCFAECRAHTFCRWRRRRAANYDESKLCAKLATAPIPPMGGITGLECLSFVRPRRAPHSIGAAAATATFQLYRARR